MTTTKRAIVDRGARITGKAQFTVLDGEHEVVFTSQNEEATLRGIAQLRAKGYEVEETA